jgi:hypothetical protein
VGDPEPVLAEPAVPVTLPVDEQAATREKGRRARMIRPCGRMKAHDSEAGEAAGTKHAGPQVLEGGKGSAYRGPSLTASGLPRDRRTQSSLCLSAEPDGAVAAKMAIGRSPDIARCRSN